MSILVGKLAFGRKNWFQSILAEKNWVSAEKFGIGRFQPKNLVIGRKNWVLLILAEETGFVDFWPRKLVLVVFSQKNRFSALLAEKHGFGRKFLERPKAKNGPKTTKSPFPTVGGPTKKKVVPAKVCFSPFGATPFEPIDLLLKGTHCFKCTL